MRCVDFEVKKEMLMKCRNAALDDCRAVYELICEIEQARLPYDRFAEIFRKQVESELYAHLVCEDGGKVIGVLNLRLEEQLHHAGLVAEILEFAVEPAYRSRGIGREMLARGYALAKERGCGQIEVACNQLRTDTHRFYLREGMHNFHFRFSRKLLGEDSGENALGR